MKKKILTVAVVLALLSGAVIVSGHATGFFDFSSQKRQTVTISMDEYQRMQRYSQMDRILQYIETWYYEEPDVDALIENATRGLLYGLGDPYSFYYNEEEWAEEWEDDEGEYSGLGMELLGNANDYTVTVTRVFRDAPAQQAGIRKGDILVRVEDIEVNFYSMTNAVNTMRGSESDVGQTVEVEVLRGDEFITFQVPRAIIHINRVEYAMLEDNVGYILLYQFAGKCQEEFAEALAALRAQGAKALVVDLRDNGGGWVDAAIDIADLFLDDQLLVYSQDRYGEKEEFRTRAGADDIPLVFLVNGNSASASEILSGGLHDQGRATLVGTQTYGKGIIQTMIGLDNDKAGFQFTYAQYYLPSGEAVHKIGITPDVISEMPEELASMMFELGDMNDPQLKDAWQTAKDLIP